MARRKKSGGKTIVRTVAAKAPTIRIAAPAPIQRYAKHARKHARRAKAGIGRFIGSSTPQLYAIGGAAILGLLQKQGVKVPKLIDSLSTPANAGLIAFGLGKLLKSATLDHLATGPLSIAAYAYMADMSISGDVLGTGVVYGDEDYSYYEYPAQ